MSDENTFIKDPHAVLDYKFDWKALTNGSGTTDWLDTAETITSATITITPTDLTKDSDALTDTDTSVTFWLSAGTAGVDYTVACKIVTSDLRTDERTMIIRVANR